SCLLCAALAVSAAACAKAPPPVAPPALPPISIVAPPPVAPPTIKAAMTIFVSADANPDSSGRPSPVYVRVYQLKGDKPFRSVDFFDVWDDEKKALGETFITR